MTKRLLLWGLGLMLVTVAAYYFLKPEPASLVVDGLKITGEITNKADVETAILTIQTNLKAASEQDLPSYLTTLVPSAREETASEMTLFFEQFKLEHELLEIEVVDQQTNQMLLKATQRTKTQGKQPSQKIYRNHISDANHTLLKSKGNWLLAETIMTNTIFIP